jgi:hypothetical protein
MLFKPKPSSSIVFSISVQIENAKQLGLSTKQNIWCQLSTMEYAKQIVELSLMVMECFVDDDERLA